MNKTAPARSNKNQRTRGSANTNMLTQPQKLVNAQRHKFKDTELNTGAYRRTCIRVSTQMHAHAQREHTDMPKLNRQINKKTLTD